MADVFLSYKREDAATAERIADALKAEGISVWWDDRITPERPWDEIIEEHISAAASVVVLWSPRAAASEWVRTEAHYAQDRAKLIPVTIEACNIPLAFLLKQTVNLCEWRGDRSDKQWRKLLTWIADLSATKPGNANIPQALGAAQPNRFREAVGYLASGDPIVDGALVNLSTPVGTAFRDNAGLPVMRIVPNGSFLIGAPQSDPDRMPVESPQKRIDIPAPFAVGVFPVLVAEYREVTGALPQMPAPPRPEGGFLGLFRKKEPLALVAAAVAKPGLPVTFVSFDDAQAFVVRLSEITGETYRILSEAEWEFACRAGSRARYACGDTIDQTQAAFSTKAHPLSGPVEPENFPPNGYGLYSMHGNVREWTPDLWHESYDATPDDGSPATAGQGAMRVVRGGGWRDAAAMLRSSARLRATATARIDVIGFRVARALN
ncbi:MAG TPA: SUMF1/EgtB/PvdO family nonheme iron enzyme [Rhizomicrobium sp.]|jgi:formylglycine-generating enzyme required for sulfatase activity